MNPPESPQPSPELPQLTPNPTPDAATPQTTGGVACPNCGRMVERGRFLCPNCGTSVMSRATLPIQPPAPMSEEERLRTPLLADLPAPHLRGEDRELDPGKTFTKSAGSDTALGIAAYFVISLVLTFGFTLLGGMENVRGVLGLGDNGASLALLSFGYLNSVLFNLPAYIVSAIAFFVLKDKYRAFGDGMRKTLRVIAILFGIGILIAIGLFALCIFGFSAFGGGRRP